MVKYIKNICLGLVLLSSNVLAAVEYFRFEGLIDLSIQPSDTPFGFAGGDSVYFDFSIDTALEAPGKTDGAFGFGAADFFQTSYLGGAVTPAQETFGVTYTLPEGTTSFLHIAEQLSIGVLVENLFPIPDDDGIDLWEVGTIFHITYAGISDNERIGRVLLTHRDIVAPSAIVPIPSAIFFFLPPLAGLLALSRRRH